MGQRSLNSVLFWAGQALQFPSLPHPPPWQRQQHPLNVSKTWPGFEHRPFSISEKHCSSRVSETKYMKTRCFEVSNNIWNSRLSSKHYRCRICRWRWVGSFPGSGKCSSHLCFRTFRIYTNRPNRIRWYLRREANMWGWHWWPIPLLNIFNILSMPWQAVPFSSEYPSGQKHL